MTTFTIGDRLSVDQCHATVKFAGTLPVWGPETVALGVEWDDPTRGKNNGDLNGVQYFKVSVDGAGLFLKASNKKIKAGVSCMDAILGRYASEENETALQEQIQFGLKIVENYGFERLNVILRNIQSLKNVMLDKQNVGFAGDLCEFSMAEYLDLSFNLLLSWDELQQILGKFGNVRSLNLNGNRFSGTYKLDLPNRLTELYLASCGITVDQVNSINLEKIEKLVLAGNKWTSDDVNKLNIPSLLLCLDLSFNDITEIPENIHQSSIQHLVLANNRICEIQSHLWFPNVVSIDLRFNSFLSWDFVDMLNLVFPNMISLRLDGNPVFSGLSPEELTMDVIARIGGFENENLSSKLVRLNGSVISPEEVRNAELYFILKVKLGKLQYQNQKRWDSLLKQYNLSLSLSAEPENSRILKLEVLTENGNELFTRTFLKNNSVLRLKGVISKHLKTSCLRIQLHYFVNDSKHFMHDDIASLQSYFLSNQKVYVSLN